MISGREFLTLAETWSHGTREAEWRCAVSRAYYAAFHESRALLNELGFMAEVSEEPKGTYKLVKRNCVLCAVARNHPDICCNTSAAFYAQLLGDVVVERRESIIDGYQNCEFSLQEEKYALSADHP